VLAHRRDAVDILLVEDSPTDADLTMRALRRSGLENVHHVVDGVDAMAFLRHEGKYIGVSTPDLILLDLNLPRKDGREVLREMRQDPEFRPIPVIVLTTSTEDQDVLKSYGLCTNAYIVKPVDVAKFFKMIEQLDHFWFDVATLPPH